MKLFFLNLGLNILCHRKFLSRVCVCVCVCVYVCVHAHACLIHARKVLCQRADPQLLIVPLSKGKGTLYVRGAA